MSRLKAVNFSSGNKIAHPSHQPVRKSHVRHNSQKRTLSASEVLDKVSKLKVERRLDKKRRQEHFQRRMEAASAKRKAMLESIRENARRFSNDERVFGRFKIKATLNGVGLQGQKYTEVIQTTLRDQYEAINAKIIVKKARAHLLRNTLKSTSHVTKLLSTSLKFNSFEKLTDLVNSPALKRQISALLKGFAVPGVSAPLSIENIFLTSVIMLRDHHSSSERERAYDTTLGPNSLQQFKQYDLPGFEELQLYNDEFYSFIVRKYLRIARRMLTMFQLLIQEGSCSCYSRSHLRLLNSWRTYVDLFHIFTNFHLKRSLLLLISALDTLESGIAIQEHVGIQPAIEYRRRDIFKTQLRSLKQQIILNDKRNADSLNSWFTLGLSFQTRVDSLFRDFTNHTHKQGPHLYWNENVIIPPGFTLLEWRIFRLNRISKELKPRSRMMHTGRQLVNMEEHRIEKEIGAIGLKTFRSWSEGARTKRDLMELNRMLFGCVGEPLTEEQRQLVENYGDEITSDYLVDVQRVLKTVSSSFHFKMCYELNDYLRLWRRAMNHFTNLWVTSSIGKHPSYVFFERLMFEYDLRENDLSLTEYLDEMRLSLHNRNVSMKLLVLEHVIVNKRTLHLKTFDLIRCQIQTLFEELKGINEALILLFCLGDGEKSVVATLYPFTKGQLKSLQSLKELIELHLFVYAPVYQKILC